MALNAAAWILSNTYTKATAEEFGAVKGASCQVGSTSIDADGNTLIELLWENTAGTKKTTTAVIQRGLQGVSILGAHFDSEGKLVIELSDGSSLTPITMPAAKVNLSKESGNNLIEKIDGLYSPKESISAAEGNTLSRKDDGLYVGEVDTDWDSISDKPFDTLSEDFDIEEYSEGGVDLKRLVLSGTVSGSWVGTTDDWDNDTGNIEKEKLGVDDVVIFTDDEEDPNYVNDDFDCSDGILKLSETNSQKLSNFGSDNKLKDSALSSAVTNKLSTIDDDGKFDADNIKSGTNAKSNTELTETLSTIDDNVESGFLGTKNLFRNVYSYVAYTSSPNTFIHANARMYYVEVESGKTYTISKTIGTRLRVVTCPEIPRNNGVVTNVNNDITSNIVTITLGENDKYIGIYPKFQAETTISYEDLENNIQVEEGNVATEYVAPSGRSNKSLSETANCFDYNMQEGFLKTSLSWDKGTINYYLKEDGTENTSSYSDKISTYIEVVGNCTYTLELSAKSLNCAMCIYDENKTYISGIKYDNNTHITFTTPSDAKYIRATLVKDGKIDIYEGEYAKSNVELTKELSTNSTSITLKDTTHFQACYGTVVTYGKVATVSVQVGAKTALTANTNYGPVFNIGHELPRGYEFMANDRGKNWYYNFKPNGDVYLKPFVDIPIASTGSFIYCVTFVTK